MPKNKLVFLLITTVIKSLWEFLPFVHHRFKGYYGYLRKFSAKEFFNR